MYKSKHVAIIDLDEFIVPQGAMRTWSDLVAAAAPLLQERGSCAFRFAKYRFYTHGSGDDLQMTNELRNRVFPENWRQVLRPAVKSETLDLIHTYDIKSLKSLVMSTYLKQDHTEKVVCVPKETWSVWIHNVKSCTNGQKNVLDVDASLAKIHHYSRTYETSQKKPATTFRWLFKRLTGAYSGVNFPYGPDPTWPMHVRSLVFGAPDVREINDTSIVKYADELSQRVKLVHEHVLP